MGPKKKKKPPPPPAKPPKFEINGFEVEQTTPGMLTMFPIIPDNFDQVCFKLRISKNFQTGKPKYEVVYYECSHVEEENSPGENGKDMRVFSLIDPETKKTYIVDPRKTQGKQPFLAFDPITNEETYIGPHQMVHHDIDTGKNYLLDLRKFKDGKLEFKDPETQAVITADLIKRLDPLTKKPVDDKLDVKFVASINNGEMYVTQDENTGALYIQDNNGNIIDPESKGYYTKYNKETNLTTLLNDKDEPILTLPGQIHLGVEQFTKPNRTFTVIEDPEIGKKTIVNDKGEVVEPEANNFYIIEDPITGKLFLVDSTGEPVPNIPEFKLKKDKVTGKTILVDMKGEPIPGTQDMIINPSYSDEDIGADSQQQAGRVNGVTDDRARLIKDPKTGLPVYVDSNNQEIPAQKMYQVTDPITGKTKFFDATGKEIKVNVNCLEEEGTEKRTARSISNGPTNTDEDIVDMRDEKPSIITLKQRTKPHDMAEENMEWEEKTDEEIYFEDLGYEEATKILIQINNAPPAARPVFLKILKQVMEMNINLMKCTLAQKLKAEEKYVQVLMEEKQERQHFFITELFQNRTGDYDEIQLHDKVYKKQDRENELLLDKMELRIQAENKVLVGVVKKNILKDSRKVIKYTNTSCYQYFKQILLKELGTKLDEENIQIKRHVCEIMLKERENTIKTIKQIVNPL